MKNNNMERSVSTLAALIIFALFAVGILAVLLGGAGVYQRLTQRDTVSYNSRTCTQYIATKLRQVPSPGAVSVASFGDADALVIREIIEQEEYLTRIYCHDGWLMELFTGKGSGFAPEDGEKILPLKGLSVDIEGGLLTISFTGEDGAVWEATHAIRGSEVPAG